MSFDVLSDLNWLAVIVAAAVYWLVGGAWYARPVFGKAWGEANGTPPSGQGMGPKFIVVPLITCLVTTIATAMIALSTGSSDFGDGIVLGIVLWVGYAAMLSLLGAVFDSTKPKPMVANAIGAGYHLVGLLVVSVIVSVWD